MAYLLNSYRGLDLCDEKGWLAGKLLADLGAEVIKVEPPGGDPSRNIGPFYHNISCSKKSLPWFAYNKGKKGITLNLETESGRGLFKKLIKRVDFVLESFQPGYMDSLGLGYKALEAVNPQIVMTSITPFGQKGPYKNYKGPDLVCWALGGFLYSTGDPDRPPVRVSHIHQSYMNGSLQGALGTVTALYGRSIIGEGQHVDVSIQQSVEACCYRSYAMWEYIEQLDRRCGNDFVRPPLGTKAPWNWECKDGQVSFVLNGGQNGISNPPLTQWMAEEGMATEEMLTMNWQKFDVTTIKQEELDRIMAPIAAFFKTHTKDEIWKEGIKRRINVYPVSDARDILNNEQLKERGFWLSVEHLDINDAITYPGAFYKSTETSCKNGPKAPLIGEHNLEIFEKELCISDTEFISLKEAGVI